jgi:uncharacterized membrane protein YhaH (DUF805 family)
VGSFGLYVAVLRRYADFRGRSARGEYWFFTLVNAAGGFLLWRADLVLGTVNRAWSVGLLSGVFGLALVVPQLAVTVRRLHDTGHGAKWLLIDLIPVVGQVWFFFLLTNPSQVGHNRFGPDPLAGMRQPLPTQAQE